MNKNLLIVRNPLFKGLIRLGLTDMLLDRYWGKPDPAEWTAIKETGFIDRPESLWFEPTMRCNLNCRFCHQRERRKIRKTELGLDAITKLLADAAGFGIRRMSMIGGEIFVRKDVFGLLDAIQAAGLTVKLGSNGLALDAAAADRLKAYSCIDSISVSIDGRPEVHDSLRNRKGAFDAASGAVRMLAGAGFMTVIYAVLLPDNLDTIRFLVETAKKLHADRITFMPEMSYTSGEVEASRRMLGLGPQDHIYVDVDDATDSAAYGPAVTAAIRHIRNIRSNTGVFVPVYPRAANRDPEAFFGKTLRKTGAVVCKHLKSLTVIENGDVVICPFIHRVIGNVTAEPVEEIWNSAAARTLRKTLLGNNLLPICAKCCSIDLLKSGLDPAR